MSWPKVEQTGNQVLDAHNDLASWESWIDSKCSGILDDMSMEEKATLYNEMATLAGENARMKKLLKKSADHFSFLKGQISREIIVEMRKLTAGDN